jgi:two-component system KDP operon response regulator KdpE
MTTGRILVASSQAEERRELQAALEFEGHQVAEVETAHETISEAGSGRHDVLLLDSGMEGAACYELCRAIRPRSDLGIIIINGNAPQSPIDALNSGADDYLPGPFVLAELLARVRAILRRVPRSGRPSEQILLHDRAIDLNAHRIRGPIGQVVHLTPKESLVLECLVAHANKPLAHQNLTQAGWQRDGQGEVEFLRIVIKQLRRKLEPDPSRPRYIVTERAFGYRFQLQPAATHSTRRPLKSPRYPAPKDRIDTPAMVR